MHTDSISLIEPLELFSVLTYTRAFTQSAGELNAKLVASSVPHPPKVCKETGGGEPRRAAHLRKGCFEVVSLAGLESRENRMTDQGLFQGREHRHPLLA
jgi:hypothetical protein